MGRRTSVLILSAVAALALPGCVTAKAPPGLPPDATIVFEGTYWGRTTDHVALAPDNTLDVHVYPSDVFAKDGKIRRFHGKLNDEDSRAVRAALAPWIARTKREPACVDPIHDAPGLSVTAKGPGGLAGTTSVYLGCQGKAYKAFADVVYGALSRIKKGETLEAEPYEVVALGA